MLSAICGRTPVASLPKRSPSLYHFAERESELLAIFKLSHASLRITSYG